MSNIKKLFIRRIKDISVGFSFCTLINLSLSENIFAQVENISINNTDTLLNNLGNKAGTIVSIVEIQKGIFKIQNEFQTEKILDSYAIINYLNGQTDTLDLIQAEQIIDNQITIAKSNKKYNVDHDYSLGRVLLFSSFGVIVNKKLWKYRIEQEYWNGTLYNARYYGKEKVTFSNKLEKQPTNYYTGKTYNGYFKSSKRSTLS